MIQIKLLYYIRFEIIILNRILYENKQIFGEIN